GVFCEHAARVAWLGRFPGLAALLQLTSGKFQANPLVFSINQDRVAVFDQGDRPAHVSFRGNMSHHKAMAAARESSVSDQRHILAESLSHEGGRWRKHFAHAGSAPGSFVADDDDIAFPNTTGEDFLHRSFFGIEYTGFAVETQAFLPGDFGDGAFGREVTV